MIGTTLFLMNFYFMFVSRSIQPALLASYFASIIVVILVYLLPESPKWLLSLDWEKEAINSFLTIGRYNKKEKVVLKRLKTADDRLDVPMSPKSAISTYALVEDSIFRHNLIICVMLWTGTTFSQYLASYTLKNLPGDFYMNLYASTSSEVAAIILSGIFAAEYNFKSTLMGGYVLAAVTGFLVAMGNGKYEYLYALAVLLSRFGVCITFNMNYVAVQRLFPSAILSTVFGITNVFARFITVFAPLIAERPDP